MKAVLEFDLPDEQTEFNRHREGPALHSVIFELRDWLRRKANYEDVRTIAVEDVRAKIADLVEEHGITTVE